MELRTDLPVLARSGARLRPWRDDDAPGIVALMDETIANYLPIPWPYSLDDARAYLEGEVWPGDDGAAATWAITEEGGGDRVVGSVGVHVVDAVERVAEAGYWLAADARGRGLGRAAVALVTEWARGEWALTSLDLVIAEDNLASQGVARACGFERTETIREYPVLSPSQERSLWTQTHHVWRRVLPFDL